MQDKIEERKALTRAILAECEHVAWLFDVDPADVEKEALHILAHPDVASEFTPEQIEHERQILHAVARRRGNLEEVKDDLDRLLDALVVAGDPMNDGKPHERQ